MLLLAACEQEPPAEAKPKGFSLHADDYVALPYVVEGEPVPSAALRVWDGGGGGSSGNLQFDLPSRFEVEGDLGPLGPGEERALEVHYDGGEGAGIFAGTATLTVDGRTVEIVLAAVIGDPDLPDASWVTSAWGRSTTVDLPSAPFPHDDAPYTDSSVFLFVPEGLSDEAGVHLVCHLHGHSTTLAEVLTTHHLEAQHALSGRDAVLVVPQGPVDAADSDFGKLGEAGGFGTLARDVVSVLYRDGLVDRPAIGLAAITAHSGGYDAAADVVDFGGLPVSAVHLFDALYGRADVFRSFAEGGGVLRSSWTDGGGTEAENEALAGELADLGVGTAFSDRELDAASVTIGRQASAHGDAPTDERSFARWLTASGLPPIAATAPELRSVASDGADTTVRWRADPSGDSVTVRVEGSDNGDRWDPLATTTSSEATVEAHAFVRLVRVDATYGESAPSDTYPGDGDRWLVVDGFDRVLDGSWTEPTHAFAADVCEDLGGGCSGVSNEAVAFGEVSLADYAQVIWLLGDESTADRTFDDAEMAAISAYVDGGGTLIVSGAEVGYASDPDWLADTLHAEFVEDDAGTDGFAQWLFGSAYPEDYPDVLDGDEVIWTYDTGGAAAVGWDGRVVVVGFGVENIAPGTRDDALADLAAWLE
ncbi:MAG: hypothetical protein ACOZNI_10390 [Myxococcota bacterium]